MKQFIYILIIGLNFTITNYIVGQNPILSYSFSGNAIDESGNGNNGEIVDAVLTSDFNGESESAYEFNGFSSYISAGDSENLRVDTALTIMACIFPKGNGSPNSGGIIVNKEGEYTLARFEDGSLRFEIADENGWDSHINTNTIIPLNEQTHVALTYSQSSGLIKLFVNSIQVYSENFDAVVGDNNPDLNELRIGGRQFLDQFFEGTIDEVRVFNIALEEEDINCMLTTDTDDIKSIASIKVYPNPSNSTIHFSNESDDINEIQIFNYAGEIIKEIHGTNLNQIDLSEFLSGYYILKFFSKDSIQVSNVIKL